MYVYISILWLIWYTVYILLLCDTDIWNHPTVSNNSLQLPKLNNRTRDLLKYFFMTIFLVSNNDWLIHNFILYLLHWEWGYLHKWTKQVVFYIIIYHYPYTRPQLKARHGKIAHLYWISVTNTQSPSCIRQVSLNCLTFHLLEYTIASLMDDDNSQYRPI